MRRIFLTGAAGLVGQNLMPSLLASGEYEAVAVDKHPRNAQILRDLYPGLQVIEADLADPGPWQEQAASSELAILLHAQIGGLDPAAFTRNNETATERVLAALKMGRCEYLVHASSSVVNSNAVDNYTETKNAQERLVAESGIPRAILRPTLMFGWFDRKHLGWLKRFMEKTPVFPVPGSGRYLRQPLYAGDFSAIVAACLERRITGTYDITGLERIDYIDLIRALRRAAGLRTPIVRIPYGLFWLMLRAYALVDRDPPFTTHQLKALVTPDVFDVIDWPSLFGVTPTPLDRALDLTYRHPTYSKIQLEF